MSSSFVHAPKRYVSGNAVAEWLKVSWDVSSFVGDEIVATVEGDMPLSKAAVVFRNFRPVTGTPGAYFADPVSIVEYRGAMLTSLSNGTTYPTVRPFSSGSGGTDVIVPLGTPAEFSHTGATCSVLMQAARNWVSGGHNRGDMSMEHVITLYYSALQSLVFATGTARTKEDQSKWLPAVYGLVRAFHTLCKEYPAALRVSEALVFTHGVNDMLQKALAHVFTGMPIDGLTGYDMLATMVRRNLRAGTLFHGLAPGPFVVLLLVPLLSGILEGSSTLEDVQTEFNKRGAAFVSELQTIHTAHSSASEAGGVWHRVDSSARGSTSFWESDDKRGHQADCLSALAKAACLPLSKEQSLKLLNHCLSTDASVEVPWSEWGVLPAQPTLACRVSTGRYGIHRLPRHYRDPKTFSSRIFAIDAHTFEVFGYKGVEWSGFQFHTPGIYTVHAHDLGIAKAAVGDTRGEELVANWRLTVGRVVLPDTTPGYSLSGMLHTHKGYSQCAPLRLDAPFQVVVKVDKAELCQDGKAFLVLERKKNMDPLLAFKNVWFRVDYAPLPPAIVATRAVPVRYGGSTASASASASASTASAAPKPTPTPFGTWASVVAAHCP